MSWTIDKFSDTQIVISKKEEGECGEHYIVKDKEGKVVIYKLLEDGTENEYEVTDISTEYITDTDKINMKNDSKILPIIRIREKTDESYSDYNNDSQIGNTLELSEVKVSAKDNYNVKLYNGIVKGNIVEFSEKPISSIPFRVIDWSNENEVGGGRK